MEAIFTKCHRPCLISIVFLATTLGMSHNCVPGDHPQCDQYDGFFTLGPTDQRDAEFLRYPIETQLEIYICGWYHEPGPRYYADCIADRGDEVIPLVLERLKRERREFSQKAIVYIFLRMAKKGYMRGRPDAVDVIRPIVSSMKNQYTRESTQQYLDEIEKDAMK